MKSTLIKFFLVLNLVLCAVVLVFGIITFKDREVVKARTLIHRQQLQEIAGNLDWGKQVAWEQEQERKAGTFQLSEPDDMEELPALTSQLEELSSFAEQRVSQLSKKFEELTQSQADLEETSTKLTAKETELADTRTQMSTMENTLANSKQSLSDNQNQVTTLTSENASLQQQVDGLDTQITAQQTQLSQKQTELTLRTGERDRIQELLAACKRPADVTGGPTEWHQKTAQILAVEPEWNYVVINRGEVDVLPMYLEAFVHRGDKFVGKVRVMQVDHTVALAEIMRDTLTTGMTIEAGDTIFF